MIYKDNYNKKMTKKTDNHIKLFRIAKKILKSKGFKRNEIFTEYKINTNEIIPKKLCIKKWLNIDSLNYHEIKFKRKQCFKHYRIDIVGINNNNKVFIECGTTRLNKLKFLETKGKVIHLKYNILLNSVLI